ncbi:MAG TPA: hypothetical protein VGE07_02200, partial [Herpetosiphonaceae bacterium]
MTWYEDLSPCNYFPSGLAPLAVGWLDDHHPYPHGRIDPETARILFELLDNPWQPPFESGGIHHCELCYLSGGPFLIRRRDGGGEAQVGRRNLFVPGAGVIYVAPSTIIHYIDAHGYLPPAEFIAALHACPPMRSPAYLKALLD